MKTKVYVILALFLVPFILSAKNNSDKTSNYGRDTTQLFYVSAPYKSYAPNVKNIIYDPSTHIISALFVINENDDDYRRGEILVWSSVYGGGLEEIRSTVFKSEYDLPYNVTFATFNTESVTGLSELEYFVGFDLDHYNEVDSTYSKVDTSTFQISETFYDNSIDLKTPIDNNEDDLYTFNPGSIISTNDNLYMYNTASINKNKNGQLGPVYFISLNKDSEEIEESKILPNFGDDKITYWSDDKTANTNSRNYIDTDQDGNLYLFAVNHLQPNHPKNGVNPIDRMRTPAFMKSTDGGKNWTDWIKFPNQKVIDFVNDNGQDPNKEFRPFGDTTLLRSFGFAVRSVDKFTAVLPVQINTTDGSEVYFVDFSYDNGVWQDLQVVHKLPMSYKLPSLVQSSDPVLIDSLVYGDRDNLEIELANVEGAEDLVLKFVQATHNVKLDSTYKVKYFDGEKVAYIDIDSLPNIGIYATSKSGEQWTNVYPEMDDEQRNECFSHIPDVVPDDNVLSDQKYYIFPMTYLLSIVPIESYYRYNYDTRMRDICKDDLRYIYLKSLTPVSVEEDKNQSISNNEFNIYPNPASTKAFIEYSGVNSLTKIEIFNALGIKVMVIEPEKYQTSDTNMIDLDLGELAIGTYYVHLTVGNETFTKTLNVVR